jgi:signal transduction histidine kinase/CheY-like chemotaxis protein
LKEKSLNSNIIRYTRQDGYKNIAVEMKILTRLSLRQRIIGIILTAALFTLIAAFVIGAAGISRGTREVFRNNISFHARFISAILSQSYADNDRASAARTLQKLINIPPLLYCGVFKNDGSVYAEYPGAGRLFHKGTLSETLAYKCKKNQILVTEPLFLHGDEVGTVVIIAAVPSTGQKMADHLPTMLIIVVISLVIAIPLGLVLERTIKVPIMKLAAFIAKTRETRDYSARVSKETLDETGSLYDSINQMLASLEVREKERNDTENRFRKEWDLLETRVLERTRELNEAKEKAEEADKLKSSFLANMSHEIRTPLNALLGFASLIREPSLTREELQLYLKMMETSGNDLINLIDDILDLSMIESNQVKINRKDIPVGPFAEEVFNVFKQLLVTDNPHNPVIPVLTKAREKSEFIMNTDPLRLKQVLMNILDNAIKFTSAGTIEFGYYPDDTGSRIIFFVRDTGIGIARDALDKIFGHFTKFTDLKIKHFRGTGLGLSIALKLTKLLGGEIRAESEPDVGSVFYLSFPLKKSLSTEGHPGRRPFDESMAFLSGKTILIVEDVENNYRYLEITLSKNRDVEILWARDGIEAVEICMKNSSIDLVLMDIQLLEMNGIEAARSIKQQNPSLPVIAQTAYVASKDVQACREAGCDDFLAKPINRASLIRVLKKYLE